MATSDEKYLVSGMSTVIIYPFEGKDLDDKAEIDRMDKKVEKRVKELVDQLKASHNKFEDPDFGPLAADEFGAKSLYGDVKPEPAGSKYPAPDSLRWERPQYDDAKFAEGGGATAKKTGEEDDEGDGEGEEGEDEDEDDEFGGFGGSGGGSHAEIFCKHGRLFIDGSSSGDVIQGQLGDCWFLSALAVLGADDDLLEKCFWRRDDFREFGLYVLRFYKDCSVFFVLIDDRLPVKAKDGRLIFAGSKDPNELWVPLIEKAYAKLHGCFKSLIGGFTHYGLADMTGFVPRLVVFKEGFTGYAQAYSPDELWAMLKQYISWNSMMGCSIQSNPKEKNKVEADAGNGLHMGHAYSLLDADTIDTTDGKKVRLVKLRNPWGRGEWEGAYGDESAERQANAAAIQKVFLDKLRTAEKVEINSNDGTFFMPFDEWNKRYTSLFIAINFPRGPGGWVGKRTAGVWTAEQGGNRGMGTWITNPRFRLRIDADPKDKPGEEVYKEVFVGLYIKDSRLTRGFDYYKDPLYATPLAFDIVTEEYLNDSRPRGKDEPPVPENVPEGVRYFPFRNGKKEKCMQPPYNFGATQLDVCLKPNVNYYIVPCLYKRNQPGSFFLTVYSNAPSFYLDGAAGSTTAGAGSSAITATVAAETAKAKVIDGVALKISVSQFNAKKEELRERLVSEVERLGISNAKLLEILGSNPQTDLQRSVFKRRMMDAGFMLTDFPENDFVVIDDNKGVINVSQFLQFVEQGRHHKSGEKLPAAPPEKPVDDLLFKAIDLSGELVVNVSGGRSLRDTAAWFTKKDPVDSGSSAATTGATSKAGSETTATPSRPKTLISYDPVAAEAARRKAIKDRSVPPEPRFESKQPANSSSAGGEGASALAPAPAGSAIGDDDWRSMPGTPERGGRAFTPSRAGGTLNAGGNRAMTVMSTMSVTKQEVVQKAGASAAIKLHTDPILQKAEMTRTKNLSLLKAAFSKKASADAVAAPASSQDMINGEYTSMLRGRSQGKRRDRRNIARDLEAVQLLGLQPGPVVKYSWHTKAAADAIAVREPLKLDAIATATTIPGGIAASKALLQIPSSVAKAPDATTATMSKMKVPDLWDDLIDRVVTIVSSRPANMATQRHRAFMDLKRKPVTSEVLRSFDDAKSPVPPPTARSLLTPTAKGHYVTPKSKAMSKGVASVKPGGAALAQRMNQTKQTINEAREKLIAYQVQQGKGYEEVFRRLVAIPVTSYEEISGERAAAGHLTLSTDSAAYLKTLFERFDTNSNGLISKDEFRLALLDLNIDVSAEECDIFFNRFSSEAPGNINWREFLAFFERQILTATQKMAAADSQELLRHLVELRSALKVAILDMKDRRLTSIEALLEARTSAATKVGVPKDAKKFTREGLLQPSMTAKSFRVEDFRFPGNAIFQTLSLGQAKTNASNMQALGLHKVNEEVMARISRIFSFSVSSIMEFIESDLPNDLDAIVADFDTALSRELLARGGKSTASPALAAKPPSLERSASTVVKGSDPVGAVSFGMGTTGKSLSANLSRTNIPDAAVAAPPIAAAKAMAMEAPSSTTSKIWSSFAANIEVNASFDTLVRYMLSLLIEAKIGAPVTIPSTTETASPTKGGSVPATPATPATAAAAAAVVEPAVQFEGVSVSVLTRLVTDTLIYSSWNRAGKAKAVPSTGGGKVGIAAAAAAPAAPSFAAPDDLLSYSGLDAYVRSNRVSFIERKLKYLMLTEANRSRQAVYFLVHAYVSSAGDELVILADDPLSGEVFKFQIAEDVRSLPAGENLKKLFLQNRALTRAMELAGFVRPPRPFDGDSLYLYNSTDMPLEDRAVSELVKRLKIVRSRGAQSKLIVAEDMQLVSTLKGLLDRCANQLPFFYLVNDLCLSFEVDERVLRKSAAEQQSHDGSSSNSNALSVRSVVFSSLRSQKNLAAYLTQVHSSLKVVLSTYNSTLRETFEWEELLAHLANQRNPFITLQLLPRFIPPAKYLYIPEEKTAAFKGDDEDDDEDDEDEDNPPATKAAEGGEEPIVLPKHKSWQRSIVDFDGAPRPTWNTKFAFNFKAPRLTSCPTRSTEIVKMLIDHSWKYVMVIVREGHHKKLVNGATIKEPFFFLTLYDPRTATEYQCGVKTGNDLHDLLYKDGVTRIEQSSGAQQQQQLSDKALEAVNKALSIAADQDLLILGPAITPRIEARVFNHRDDKFQELLGTSQISISSVLSGSGVADKIWVKLVRSVEKNAAYAVGSSNESATKEVEVGELEIELRFRKALELEAEEQARRDREKKALRIRTDVPTANKTDSGEPSTSAVIAVGGAKEKAGPSTKELLSTVKELEAQRDKALAEMRKLRDDKTPIAASAAAANANADAKPVATAAAIAASSEEMKAMQAAVVKLEEEKRLLAAAKKAADKEKEDLQQKVEAHSKEIAQLTTAAKSNTTNNKAGGTIALQQQQQPSAEAKPSAQAIAAEEQLRKAMVEKEAAAKAQVSAMSEQLSKARSEHAEALQEIARLKRAAENAAALAAAATSANVVANNHQQPAAAGTSIAPRQSATEPNIAATPSVAVATVGGSGANDLHQILTVLIQRQERRLRQSGPAALTSVTPTAVLDSLSRLLHSYASPEGLVSHRELQAALQELLIDIPMETAVGIVQGLGPDSRKGGVQVHALVNYMKNELQQMLKGKRKEAKELRDSAVRTSQEAPETRPPTAASAAANNNNTQPTFSKQRPASAAPPRSNNNISTAAAEKKASTTHGQGSGSASRESLGERGSKTAPLPKTSSATAPAAAAAAAAAAAVAASPAAISTAPAAEDAPPLPAGWEKRWHAATKKFVFIDHQNHKTQWNHPLMPSNSPKKTAIASAVAVAAPPAAAAAAPAHRVPSAKSEAAKQEEEEEHDTHEDLDGEEEDQ